MGHACAWPAWLRPKAPKGPKAMLRSCRNGRRAVSLHRALHEGAATGPAEPRPESPLRQTSSRDPAVRTTPSIPYSCEDGVGSVAPTVPEVLAAYTAFRFEMAEG
jgi:hypothetical protein